MKKNFYLGLIALATLSVTSCSKNETIMSVPKMDAIEFGTYLGQDVESRGVELTNTNFENFGVFASYTGQAHWNNNTPNFMYNQLVTNNGVAWEYSPLKYWPTTKGDKISFFAYAPHDTDATTGIQVYSKNNTAAAPVIIYTITDADLETQADFVTDVLVDVIKGGNGTSIDREDRTVNFTLQHELTRVNITAKLDREAYNNTNANQTQVNIKSIKFNGAQFWTKANYTFATTDESRGSWAPVTAGVINIANLLNINNAVNLGNYTTSGILLPNTTAVELFKKDQYLFLIPHGAKGLESAGAVKMEVAYDIVTVDGALDAGYSVTPATKIINLPAGLLVQGTAYQLNLTFGLNEIKLNATVSEWDTAENDQNVDWPKQDA